MENRQRPFEGKRGGPVAAFGVVRNREWPFEGACEGVVDRVRVRGWCEGVVDGLLRVRVRGW